MHGALADPGDAMPRGHTVVAGVLVRDGRILLCHRRPDRAWFPDVWDVPGGHIEAGEDAQEALARELAEELGVIVGDWRLLGRVVEPRYDVTFIQVDTWQGEPTNRACSEHDRIGWFTLAEALTLPLPDARYARLFTVALAGTP